MAFLLQFVSIVVFTFGAPAFTVLALSYLRQRKPGNGVFRVFTVICALTFVDNLASAVYVLDFAAINVARALLAGLLPPMMANLLLQQEPGPGPRRFWRVLLGLLYLAAIVSAVVSAIGAQGPWNRYFDNSSQIVLGSASLFALTVLLFTRGERTRAERRQRFWNIGLFAALLLSAIAAFASDNPFFTLVPDYVVLLYFAVRLYYTERVAFFDTFIKGGSYFAVGSILIALALLTLPPFAGLFATDWIRATLAILALMPVWLLGPFLYGRLGRLTDLALHRRYTAIDAERLFLQSAQTGASEEQLRVLAAASLRDIFSCEAEVDFNQATITNDPDELVCLLVPEGHIRLLARPNQVPFLSADLRLLTALAATLGVLLQNARLRAQQADQLGREQELAALASRAELRALRAQINPHFLFNALNAIAGWIRTEPEFADETVAQLAEVFRYTLQRSQSEWVQVQEEVDFVRAYLAVERARFRDRLDVEIVVDPAADRVQIPAMMIQPIVENAIKHGASLALGLGKVTVTIRRCESALNIEVTDNGPGFPAGFILEQTGFGHGLWNVAQRLRGYYGEGATLTWQNRPVGCCVTLAVRLREGA